MQETTLSNQPVRTQSTYVMLIFLKHFTITLSIFLLMYLLVVLPANPNVADDEKYILYVPAAAMALVYFLFSLPFILQAFLHSKRQHISFEGDSISITTGALSTSTVTIPLKKVNYAHANSSFIETIFDLATVEIGTDSSASKIVGVSKSQADAFIKKLSLL